MCVCECLCLLRLNVLRSARCQMWSKQNNKNTHSMFACVCTHEYMHIYICVYVHTLCIAKCFLRLEILRVSVALLLFSLH